MKRNRALAFEPLEGRALLSGAAAAASPPVVDTVPQGLEITLTTNKKVYQEGQPVRMTLRETNTSHHRLTVGLGPSVDGFYVTRDGEAVWASNAGPQPLFILLKTLRPGRSVTLRATWDGHSNLGPPSTPTGTLVVHSQVPGAPTVTIHIRGS